MPRRKRSKGPQKRRSGKGAWLSPLFVDEDLKTALEDERRRRSEEVGSEITKLDFARQLLRQGLSAVQARGWVRVGGPEAAVDDEAYNVTFLRIASALHTGILTAEEASQKLAQLRKDAQPPRGYKSSAELSEAERDRLSAAMNVSKVRSARRSRRVAR
jgi:hypothetical protein